MLEFELDVPFEWEPGLSEDSWIVALETQIIRYPSNYGVSSDGYYYKPVILHWMVGGTIVAGRHYLNYFHQQLLPPEPLRPSGIKVGWPSGVALKGMVTIGNSQSNDGTLEILRRVEGKIDALP